MYLGIYCAGRLGKELYDIALRINALREKWEGIFFIDDFFDGELFYNAPVYRPDDVRERIQDFEVVIANGTPVERKNIRNRIELGGFELTNLIDPTVIISPTAKMGKGIIISPFSTISSDVTLNDNVLIHSYVRVGHDIVIREDSVLSSNVCIGGRTYVGEQTYIGMGAVVKDELCIGSNSIISMGSVVHTSIDDGVIVTGLPARVSRKNEDGRVFKQ